MLAFARRPFRRDLALLAALLPLGVLGQAVMGGLTVLYGLAPGWVMAHFALSMVIIVAAGALVVARAAGVARRASGRATWSVARWVWALFALGGVTLFAGTAATAAGPARRRLGHRRRRRAAGVQGRGHGRLADRPPRRAGRARSGVLAIACWWVARRRGADAALVHRLARVCLLMAAQGVLGLVQYQLEVPAEMVWVHVALATLLWVGIVLAAVQVGSPRAGRLVPESASSSSAVSSGSAVVKFSRTSAAAASWSPRLEQRR